MPWGIAAAGALSAGASLYGSSEAAGAAKGAAAQSQQQINFNNVRTTPYTVYGQDAMAQLDALNQQGFTAGQPNYLDMAAANVPNANNMANLVNTPGYQFNLTQGLQATQSAAAARGLGVSGAALKGAASYATGLADSTYQNQFNNQQQKMTDYLNLNTGQQANATNLYNRLSGTATIGANVSTNNATTNAGLTNASGNFLTSAGTASAAGASGVGNAANSAVNNALGYSTLQGLLGKSGGVYGGVDAGGWDPGGGSIGGY